MKTILFPTDFTDSTANALDWARLFARQYNAKLILLHIEQITTTTVPTVSDFGMGMIDAGPPVNMETIDREQLDKLATQLESEGLTCQTELRRGAVTEAIVTAASDFHADLIIAGRSRLSNFFERLLGTGATGIARKAHCPVLVVPIAEARPVQLRTMLFSTPLAFDQLTEFSQTVDMAHTFGATLSVLHIHAENQPRIADANQMLAPLQQLYGDQPLPVHTVESRTVTGGIKTFLETNHPDLLVMTNRDRDFLSGLLDPSLTDRVLVSATMPILVYHAQATE